LKGKKTVRGLRGKKDKEMHFARLINADCRRARRPGRGVGLPAEGPQKVLGESAL